MPDKAPHRYAHPSQLFIDAYYQSLDGNHAAWASRKYCGHCAMLETLMEDLLKAKI